MPRLLLFVLTLFIALPPLASAALLPERNLLTEITSSPEFPRPNETVTLTAGVIGESGAFSYIWTVDGASFAEGVGLVSIPVKAGPGGSAVTVGLTLVDIRGKIQGSRTFVLRPAEVDLVWDAKTYTPPLFEGRPLPNQESRVTVLAVPRLIDRGAAIPASQLMYTWFMDGRQVGATSYGKSAASFAPPFFERPFTVSVLVKTVTGLYAGEGSVTIRPVKPIAVIYEDHPLSGVSFNRSAPRGALIDDEVTYRAYPIYVQNPGALVYQWLLNGKPFTLDGEDRRVATFRKSRDAVGSFKVGFSFTNEIKSFESGTGSFTVALQ